jgi:hypothetical protein
MTGIAHVLVVPMMGVVLGAITVNAQSDPLVIFSFDSPQEPGHASVVNDGVMGGISSSQWKLTPEGIGVFSGVVSLERNGGFASMRLHPPSHKLGEYAGLEIKLKGDGKKYQLTLKQGRQLDGVMYRKTQLTQAGEWQVIRAPFDQFVPIYHGRLLNNVPPIDPAYIGSIGVLIADGQAGPFRLELDWVKAYTAE